MAVDLVRYEFRENRPAREVVLTRLSEVLLIEVLRSTVGITASVCLLRGVADVRPAAAIRQMHKRPVEAWTVTQQAKESILSRSTFFERSQRAVGRAPMEYLLAWRWPSTCSGRGRPASARWRSGWGMGQRVRSAWRLRGMLG